MEVTQLGLATTAGRTRAVILTRATPENMGSYFPSIFEPGTPMLYAYIGFNHHGRDYQIRCYPLLITPGSLQVWGFFSDKKVQYSDFAHVSFGQAEFSYTEPYFNSKGEVILGGWRCTKNCFSGEDNGSNRWKTGRLEIESVGLSFNPERFNIKGALIKDDGVRVNFNLSQPRWF